MAVVKTPNFPFSAGPYPNEPTVSAYVPVTSVTPIFSPIVVGVHTAPTQSTICPTSGDSNYSYPISG